MLLSPIHLFFFVSAIVNFCYNYCLINMAFEEHLLLLSVGKFHYAFFITENGCTVMYAFLCRRFVYLLFALC